MADQAQTEMQMGSGDEEELSPSVRGCCRVHPRTSCWASNTRHTVKFDEIVEADHLCDAEELGRPATHLDQQLSHLQGVTASSPTACSAA